MLAIEEGEITSADRGTRSANGIIYVFALDGRIVQGMSEDRPADLCLC